MTPAHVLITELKNFSTQKNTRANFVNFIQTNFKIASIKNFALSLTRKMNFQLTSSKKWKGIMTFTCFTLKQFGVHKVKKNTKETLVFMLIIGKTSGANHITSITATHSVHNGKLKKILKLIKMAASLNIVVRDVMAGKNKNTIHWTLKLSHANLNTIASSLTAHTTTLRNSDDNCPKYNINFSLETEVPLQAKQLFTIKIT